MRCSGMTDNYILAYWDAICSGRVTVGRWVRLIYQMIVEGIAAGRYVFDAKKANNAIRFVECFCHHSKGRSDLIKLELWQKALISCIFGVMDHSGKRQFREVVVIIARKNGKSLLASAIIACLLYIDGEYGAEIYCIARSWTRRASCTAAFGRRSNRNRSFWK